MNNPKKVLIAGDKELLEDAGRAIRRLSGTKLFTASTTDEALMLHIKEKADFIVADLSLPMIGGDGLCSEIRANEDLKRVYVTLVCSGKIEELHRCGECGANNYITKPIDSAELIDRMVRVLELTSKRAERILVKVSVKGIFNNEAFFCSSRNISATGMLIETDKALAIGDTIRCSFFLPDTERVEAEAGVVRITKGEIEGSHGYGVEFMSPSGETLGAIRDYVSRVMG